jgi:hypothetical protein
MPKISTATAGALEAKEAVTTAFTVGRQIKKKPILFSPKQTEQVRDIFSFRTRYAIREQELEGKIPSEMDQTTAEVAKLLSESKDLGELSSQQMALTYFSLREVIDDPQHKYWTKAVEGLKGRKRQRELRREKKLVRRTIYDFERRLIGRNYGRTGEYFAGCFHRLKVNFGLDKEPRARARELLLLNQLIEKHGGNAEKAAADFSGSEIARILSKREKPSQERIETAKESTNPIDKKWAVAAERIPQLVEQGAKKRKEIGAWRTAKDFRQFINPQLTEQDFTSIEMIMSVLKNNQDLANRYLVSFSKTSLKELEEYFSTLNATNPVATTNLASKIVGDLVSQHSFNSVVDTVIGIIDSKLPALEALQPEAVKTEGVKLTPELTRQAGTKEICLEILLGEKIPEELISDGFPENKVRETIQIYLNKQADGSYTFKEVGNDIEIQEAERAAQKQVETTRSNEIKIAQTELAQGELEIIKDTDSSQHLQRLTTAKSELEGILNIKINNLYAPEVITQAAKKLVEEKPDYYKQQAIGVLRKTNPDFAQEYNAKLQEKYISEGDMIALGAETLTPLYEKGFLTDSQLAKLKDGSPQAQLLATEIEKLRVGGPEPMLEVEAGKTTIKPEELAKKKKDKVPLSQWAIFILLGLMGLNEAVNALKAVAREDDARQLPSLLGV